MIFKTKKIIILLHFLVFIVLVSYFFKANIKEILIKKLPAKVIFEIKDTFNKKDFNRSEKVLISHYDKEYFLDNNIEKYFSINKEVKISSVKLNFLNSYNISKKAGGYIDFYKKDLFLATGNAEFYKITIDNNNKISTKYIESNLDKIIKNYNEINEKRNKSSVADLTVIEDKFYIAAPVVSENNNYCYHVGIFSSKINMEKLIFEEIFRSNDCSYNISWGIGGRIVKFDKQNILITTSDMQSAHSKYNEKIYPQIQNSDIGKIIKINLNNKKTKKLSFGHRNPQGLFYIKNSNEIISTEHGPKGGDEINLIKSIDLTNNNYLNFGWPISSYGDHYDGKFRKKAPLKKSHIKYGFIEPIKVFDKSIGISEILENNILPKSKSTYRSFIVGALGYEEQIDEGDQSIHFIEFSENFDQIINHKIEYVNSRIRDMKIFNNKIFIVDEKNEMLKIISFNE